MELAPDFNEFFELLHAHRVEYVVVGGYALALHGAPRYTGDLGGAPIPFIGREAFLQNKRAAGRTKDLADIEAIGGKPGAPD